MDISAAALPPRQPTISTKDRTHPLFRLYQQHLSSCSLNLIEASAFADWLYQREQNEKSESAAAHPRYADFLAWMRANRAGARPCPAGTFPRNFQYWLDGGRW